MTERLLICTDLDRALISNGQQSESPGQENCLPVWSHATKLPWLTNRTDVLYIARDNFEGMNGNYSAGIIEGIVHYHPQIIEWLKNNAEAPTP